MYKSGQYISMLKSHLYNTFNKNTTEVKIITKFPDSFIFYPVPIPTFLLSCHRIEFESVGSQPSGVLTIEIRLYTERDVGMEPHTDILDRALEALTTLSDFSFSSITVKDARFDRPNSAICTQILCRVNFQ